MGGTAKTVINHSTVHCPTLREQGPEQQSQGTQGCTSSQGSDPACSTLPKQLLLHPGCSRSCLPRANPPMDGEQGSIPAPAAALALPPRPGAGQGDLWCCLQPLGSHKSLRWPQRPHLIGVKIKITTGSQATVQQLELGWMCLSEETGPRAAEQGWERTEPAACTHSSFWAVCGDQASMWKTRGGTLRCAGVAAARGMCCHQQ